MFSWLSFLGYRSWRSSLSRGVQTSTGVRRLDCFTSLFFETLGNQHFQCGRGLVASLRVRDSIEYVALDSLFKNFRIFLTKMLVKFVFS